MGHAHGARRGAWWLGAAMRGCLRRGVLQHAGQQLCGDQLEQRALHHAALRIALQTPTRAPIRACCWSVDRNTTQISSYYEITSSLLVGSWLLRSWPLPHQASRSTDMMAGEQTILKRTWGRLNTCRRCTTVVSSGGPRVRSRALPCASQGCCSACLAVSRFFGSLQTVSHQ